MVQAMSTLYIYIYPLLITADHIRITWEIHLIFYKFSFLQVLSDQLIYLYLLIHVSVVNILIRNVFLFFLTQYFTVINVCNIFTFTTQACRSPSGRIQIGHNSGFIIFQCEYKSVVVILKYEKRIHRSNFIQGTV